MIPPDVASNLRLLQTDPHITPGDRNVQPTPATQRIVDALGDLVPGQRLLAEIHALLPNGSYRAVVAQRDITLALPFAAKPGDSLELEVVDNDGKVAFAVVSGRPGAPGSSDTSSSVSTTLSQTGRLIGDLLSGLDRDGGSARPAPLNASQPLVESMPGTAADLAPVLKQALTQSGMFYEAHQARWVAGDIPTSQLLQEPQGGHSLPQPSGGGKPASHGVISDTTAMNAPPPDQGSRPAQLSNDATSPQDIRGSAEKSVQIQTTTPRPSGSDTVNTATLPSSQGAASSPSVPPDLAPLVQQQLNALATQTFAWQGQIWPGQQMFWEIDEDSSSERDGAPDEARPWRTRLKLQLPSLGTLEATLLLHSGNQVEIALQAGNPQQEGRLSLAGKQLGEQFEAAGLNLIRLTVDHGASAD